ncbi:hypothetical protein [Terrabacter sp. NPDC080008]|uniref:hypothetical protein n=1 Tax=Terrabacter sp. NPDC080008 TaxID=3155176 RepID=UPI00344C67CC
MVSTGENDGIAARVRAGRRCRGGARWAAVLVAALVLPLAGCAKEGRVDTAAPWGAAATSGPVLPPARTVTVMAPAVVSPTMQPTTPSPGASGAGRPVMVGHRVSARRAGVSFDVPDGWRAIDPALATSGGAPALPDSFRALAQQSGQTPEEFLKRIGTLMEVLVMAPPRHGFADNVSVIPTPVGLPSAQELRDQLATAGAAVVSVQRLATPVGDALVAKSRLTIGTKVVSSRSIALEVSGRLTYITVSASDWSSADTIADGILRSLRRA